MKASRVLLFTMLVLILVLSACAGGQGDQSPASTIDVTLQAQEAQGGVTTGTPMPGEATSIAVLQGTADPMMDEGTPGAGSAMDAALTGTPGAMMPETGAMFFDQMFINMMVPHHQSAIAMAEVAQERAEHPEIKQMAEEIISSQQAEIDQMLDWNEKWFGTRDVPDMSQMPMLHGMPGMEGHAETMDMQAEVEVLRQASEPFDQAFITMMIAHHQSAVDAAELALEQAERQEIRDLAQDIIAEQQREIKQMQAWQQEWYSGAATAVP